MKDALKILILEDVPTDAELMRRELEKANLRYKSRVVGDRASFSRELHEIAPDIILSDYLLPDFDGISALETARRTYADIPFIFVSGAIGEEKAIETLKRGATDYVLKDKLSALGPAVKRALSELKQKQQIRQAEESLRVNQDKLRSLTAELQIVEERQRRRIALELHDSLSQLLAFAKMELGGLSASVPREYAESINHVREMIDKAIQQSRNLTLDLSPPTLHSLGLEAALEEMAEQFSEESHLLCEYEQRGQSIAIGEQMKILLYRSARELVINAIKHSEANKVNIFSQKNHNSVTIIVTDNGRGFDLSFLEDSTSVSDGFGLFSIRERLSHMGGKFDLKTQPGEGTTVSLWAPLQANPHIKIQE